MKRITRGHAKVDRIARPRLAKNFVDNDAEFFSVPGKDVIRVAGEQKAILLKIPNAQLGHNGNVCSSDAIMSYQPDRKEPALTKLAKIDRGVNTAKRALTPQSNLPTGFSMIAKDDYDDMAKQFPFYGAVFAFCKTHIKMVE